MILFKIVPRKYCRSVQKKTITMTSLYLCHRGVQKPKRWSCGPRIWTWRRHHQRRMHISGSSVMRHPSSKISFRTKKPDVVGLINIKREKQWLILRFDGCESTLHIKVLFETRCVRILYAFLKKKLKKKEWQEECNEHWWSHLRRGTKQLVGPVHLINICVSWYLTRYMIIYQGITHIQDLFRS